MSLSLSDASVPTRRPFVIGGIHYSCPQLPLQAWAVWSPLTPSLTTTAPSLCHRGPRCHYGNSLTVWVTRLGGSPISHPEACLSLSPSPRVSRCVCVCVWTLFFDLFGLVYFFNQSICNSKYINCFWGGGAVRCTELSVRIILMYWFPTQAQKMFYSRLNYVLLHLLTIIQMHKLATKSMK